MTITKPTKHQIALSHVAYEIDMCAAAAARAFLTPQGDRLAHIAYLESMLLHVRNLDDYFTKPKPQRNDDLTASQLTGDWTPTPAAACARLSERRDLINKHLSHLTLARVEDNTPPEWPIIEMARDIVDIATDWIKHFAATQGVPVTDPYWDGLVIWNSVKEARSVLAMP